MHLWSCYRFVLWSGVGLGGYWLVMLALDGLGLDVGVLLNNWFLMGLAVVLLILTIAPISRILRGGRRRGAPEFRLCPECAFDLCARAPEGACPDCGRLCMPGEGEKEWRGVAAIARFVLELTEIVRRLIGRWQEQRRRYPKIVRRQSWIGLGFALVPMVGVAAISIVAILGVVPPAAKGNAQTWLNSWLFRFLGLQVISLIVSFAILGRYRKSLRNVKRQGSLVCPECMYALDQLPSPGSCPECGHGYTHDELRETWKPYTSGL